MNSYALPLLAIASTVNCGDWWHVASSRDAYRVPVHADIAPPQSN